MKHKLLVPSDIEIISNNGKTKSEHMEKMTYSAYLMHGIRYLHRGNSFLRRRMINATLFLVFATIVQFSLFYVVSRYVFKEKGKGREDCVDRSSVKYGTFVFFVTNLLICYPAMNWKGSALYSREVEHAVYLNSLRSTWLLQVCELVILIELPSIVFLLCASLANYYWNDVVEKCAIADHNVAHGVSILKFLGSYFVYYLYLKQIALFNQMRNHQRFELGTQLAATRIKLRKKSSLPNTKEYGVQLEWMKAVQIGNVPLVQALVQDAKRTDGSNFHTKWYPEAFFLDMLGISTTNPLHVACMEGHTEVVKVLLQAGFDVNTRHRIRRATEYSFISQLYNVTFSTFGLLNSQMGKSLYGSDIGEHRYIGGTMLTPLHIAVATGDIATTKVLLQAGADPNKAARSTIQKEATPPLFWCKSVECVTALVHNGANILCIAGKSFMITPYQLSIILNKMEIARCLQKLGGDIVLTPLHECAASGKLERLKERLLFCKNPDMRGECSEGLFKRTPLHWAAIQGQTEAAAFLLDYGATLDALDSNFATPLQWAATRNHEDTVEMLLKRGANASNVDLNGDSIVVYLSKIDGISCTIFKLLAEHGANMNAKDHNGESALHIAIRHQNRQTAFGLIRSGSNLMITNALGQRALDCTTSTEWQFAFKKEAGCRDVMISYTHTHRAFANKLKASLESNFVTAWLDNMDPSGIGGGAVWREEIARGILGASVVLCIVSSDYSKSQWCMKELAFAKQHDIPVVAIVTEEHEFSQELKVALFSRQLIDFTACIQSSSLKDHNVSYIYNDSDYTRCLHFLLDGLRDEIELRRVQVSSNSPIRKPIRQGSITLINETNESDRSSYEGYTLFITGSPANISFMIQLKARLCQEGYNVQLSSHIEGSHNVGADTASILSCDIFVSIYSSQSHKDVIVSDQLGFAENNEKHIKPILLYTTELSLATQFSISRCPIFHFAQELGFEESFRHLALSCASCCVGINALS